MTNLLYSIAGGRRLEVRSHGAGQDLPIRIHDSLRVGDGAHHIPSADLLRQHQANRHPILQNCQEETRAAQNGLGRRPWSLKFVLRLRPLAAEDVLGADRHVVAWMIYVKLPAGNY